MSRWPRRVAAPCADGCPMAVYIHRMIRAQLYLDERVHQRLRGIAGKQGRTVSDLVQTPM